MGYVLRCPPVAPLQRLSIGSGGEEAAVPLLAREDGGGPLDLRVGLLRVSIADVAGATYEPDVTPQQVGGVRAGNGVREIWTLTGVFGMRCLASGA